MNTAKSTVVVSLTERDRRIFHALWSAGALDGETLRWAISPGVRPIVFYLRLTKLVQSNHLSRRKVTSLGGSRWLYSLGPNSLPLGTRSWKPSLNQLDHTMTIGRVLNRILRPGFGMPLTVTRWEGEAEIRANAVGDQPYPDLRVFWTCEERVGSWAVEVDRSTEGHPVWRRKMVRYLGGPEQVLAITISKQRAQGLIAVGREVGVDLLATTEELLRESVDPPVLSARLKARLPLSEATLASRVGVPRSADSS